MGGHMAVSRVGLLQSVDEVVSRLMGVEPESPELDPDPVYEGRCIEGCGACCNPVTLPQAKSATPTDNPADRAWLRRLRRISFADAEARYASIGVEKHADPQVSYYACPDFDADQRICGRYETRPPVCRKFPWGYYGEPMPDVSLPPTCGYRVDIGLEVQPVTLIRKPSP